MAWIVEAVKSSIGKKYILGAMGLLLCMYLAVHLAGNMVFFAGRDAFNAYAHALESVPILPAIELALAAVFLIHIVLAVITWFQNLGARDQGYAMVRSKGGRTLANTTMIYSGAIVFVFLVVHVSNLRYGARPETGLYGKTVDLFHNPYYSAFYVVCVCILGAHVWHGLQSAFRSLGVYHPKYTPVIEWVSRIFGVVVAVGFASIPIWTLFFLGGVS